MRRPPPLPTSRRSAVTAAGEARFSETLWFKTGAIELDPAGDPTPLPLPLMARYSVSDRLPLADRQQFSLNSHVPPPPVARRRATSIVEPYSDDDLERYAVRGWLQRIERRHLGVAAGIVALTVAMTATFAMTSEPSRPVAAGDVAVASDTVAAADSARATVPRRDESSPAAELVGPAEPRATSVANHANTRRARAKPVEPRRVLSKPAEQRRATAKRTKRVERRHAKAKRTKRVERDAKTKRAKAKRTKRVERDAKAKRAKAKRAKAKRTKTRRTRAKRSRRS